GLSAVAMSEGAASVLAEVGDFQKDKLKHVDPAVKNVLPTADDVKNEKNESKLMHDIEQGTHLKKVKTVEKNSLPTKEDIEREKKEQK
ncbi:hypothetical protein, partial [Neisseria meningitidis]|uniref:hypothetical protein n=1 Tax=Neisseria meningitidis TaxID=487 RepID=UPI001C57D362